MPKLETIGEIRQYVIVAVVTMTSAFSAIFGYQEVNPPRPFPYTSIDAQKDREAVQKELEAIRMEMIRLREQQEAMKNELHKLALDVGKLPPKEWQDRIRRVERCQDRLTPQCFTGPR